MMKSLRGARASRPLVSLAAATIFALAGGVAAVGLPVPVPPPAGTTQELVFFTADGPVRVRFAVTLGGRPAPDLWKAAVDSLFTACDRNGDGVLDEKERAAFATRMAGYYSLRGNIAVDFDIAVINGIRTRTRMPHLQFPDKAKVDPAGLREALVASGAGPVGVNTTAPRGDSAALSDALFKYLDTDKDGMLSAKELAAARAVLAPIDVDEDEALTADELLGRSQNQNAYVFQVTNLGLAFGQQQPQAQLADILFPQAGQPVTAKDILAARDADQSGSLTAKELGCDPKALARLDADGNGTLDADELAAWLRQPPDLDLKTDLAIPAAPANAGWLPLPNVNTIGPVPATPVRPSGPITPNGKSRFADRLKAEPDGALAALLPDLRVRFEADAADAGQAGSPWQAAVEGLRAVVTQLAGGKGEVTRKQLEEKPELATNLALFDLADRNQDGKVTTEELTAVAAAGDPLRNCRVVVAVADVGRGLFELLDRDDDGRLSPRELALAPALVARFDRNGDGKLSRDELPRGVTVTARPASLELPPPAGQAESYDLVLFGAFDGVPRAQRPTPVPADVPEWFRAMDRNGDGDITAREFTGPAALFQKIDADGDGLISPAEARAFETAAKK